MKTILIISILLLGVKLFSQTQFKVETAVDLISRSELKSAYHSIQLQDIIILKTRRHSDTLYILKSHVFPGGKKFEGLLNGVGCSLTLVSETSIDYTATIDTNNITIRYYLKKTSQ